MLSLFFVTALYAGQANPAAPEAASPESIANGAALYKRQCVMCHGAKGLGDGPAAKSMKGKLPSLADKALMSELTDAEIYQIIAEGRRSDIGNMPARGKNLKPQEITDIVNYVRTFAK